MVDAVLSEQSTGWTKGGDFCKVNFLLLSVFNNTFLQQTGLVFEIPLYHP
jgi:hypothetical protein